MIPHFKLNMTVNEHPLVMTVWEVGLRYTLEVNLREAKRLTKFNRSRPERLVLPPLAASRFVVLTASRLLFYLLLFCTRSPREILISFLLSGLRLCNLLLLLSSNGLRKVFVGLVFGGLRLRNLVLRLSSSSVRGGFVLSSLRLWCRFRFRTLRWVEEPPWSAVVHIGCI